MHGTHAEIYKSTIRYGMTIVSRQLTAPKTKPTSTMTYADKHTNIYEDWQQRGAEKRVQIIFVKHSSKGRVEPTTRARGLIVRVETPAHLTCK